MTEFETTLHSTKIEQGVVSTPGREDISYSSPVPFGGVEGQWTPEDLMLAAIESCQHLTTMFFVKKEGIEIIEYRSQTSSRLDKTPQGLRFPEITIKVCPTIAKEEDREKMAKAIELGHSYCPVGAAMEIPIKVEMDIKVQGG